MIDKERILNALDDFKDEYSTSFSSAYMEETSIIEDALDMYYEKLKEKKDIDLEKPQHFTKEQALWIKKYCSIKNREFYNQAIDNFADGIRKILKDNAIYNMDCINTLANQLKTKDIGDNVLNYIYYVSFYHEYGYGSVIVTLIKPMDTSDVISEVKDYIERQNNVSDVTILDWKRLRS